MPRYGRTVPDDTRPAAHPPVMWDDVALYDQSKSDIAFFEAMTRGPSYIGPRGQACNFQPVANKNDPRPRRFSEMTGAALNAVDTQPRARSSNIGRATGRGHRKPNAEDRYAWAHEPLFVMPGFDQTPLDRGRHISHENLVL